MLRRSSYISLFLISLFLSGCAAAVVGAGIGAGTATAVYVKGELQQVHSADFQRTWEAILVTLKEMEIKILETQKDGLGGKLKAVRADGTNLALRAEPANVTTTKVWIRVGTWGNKKASELIQGKIAANLKQR